MAHGSSGHRTLLSNMPRQVVYNGWHRVQQLTLKCHLGHWQGDSGVPGRHEWARVAALLLLAQGLEHGLPEGVELRWG